LDRKEKILKSLILKTAGKLEKEEGENFILPFHIDCGKNEKGT